MPTDPGVATQPRVALVSRRPDGTIRTVETEASGVHLGRWTTLPSTVIHETDAAYGTVAPEVAAALRLHFAETGELHAEGDATLAAEPSLRDAAKNDPGAFHRVLAERALRLSGERTAIVATTRARGDVLRDDTVVVDVRANDVEVDHAARAEHDAWARGALLPSPDLAFVLRALRHGPLAKSSIEEHAWEVAPAVRMLPVRTPTLPPAMHTNAFLVGNGECVLVEPASPFPEELDRLATWVEDAMACGVRPRAILATHHHPDHIGGATALAARLGLPLWAHRATAARLEGEVVFDRFLDDGERIELDGPDPVVLEAVHTPGHAPGHLCFLEHRSGALIAGDMVAGVGTILVETHDGDMALYLESLRRMKALEPTMLLPAHGGVIRGASTWLDHYVAHRTMRELKVLDALAKVGPATIDELVPVAYDDASPAVFPLARLAVAAHLVKLVREGRAREAAGRFRVP